MALSLPTIEGRFAPDEAAHYRAMGHWGDAVLADFLDRAVEARVDSVFVTDSKDTATYSEVHEQSLALASGLAGLGVKQGDRVVVQLPNWIEAVIAYFAVARLGAVFVPRMMIYREHEILDTVSRTEAKAFIVTNEFRGFDHLGMARSVQSRCSSLEHLVVVGDPGPGEFSFSDLCELGPYDGPHPAADDPHIILFTSGTTAQPKAAVHTFNTYIAGGKALSDGWVLTQSDVCLMPSPVMHNTGLLAGVVGPLYVQGATVLQDVWDASEAIRLVERHRVTYTCGAPPFVTMMVDARRSSASTEDISSFRLFACGGAPIPGSVVRDAIEVLGCKVITVFGQSEASMQTHTHIDDPVEVVASSDGRAVPGMGVRILDEKDVEVPPGEEGEICCHGPGVMLGYWQDPERTASVLKDGWFHSGDYGVMNSSGYLRVTGRKSDIIIRGGMNISPAEIDELLLEHPDIADVSVVGYPDRVMGERACAFIVSRGSAQLSLDDIRAFMRDRKVMVQKIPERLIFVDSLPRTATGKVEKYQLRAELAKLDGQTGG
jgi:non-ribosomal peptide synthetase component E (peptide arylation enzyme)